MLMCKVEDTRLDLVRDDSQEVVGSTDTVSVQCGCSVGAVVWTVRSDILGAVHVQSYMTGIMSDSVKQKLVKRSDPSTSVSSYRLCGDKTTVDTTSLPPSSSSLPYASSFMETSSRQNTLLVPSGT